MNKYQFFIRVLDKNKNILARKEANFDFDSYSVKADFDNEVGHIHYSHLEIVDTFNKKIFKLNQPHLIPALIEIYDIDEKYTVTIEHNLDFDFSSYTDYSINSDIFAKELF